MAKELTTDLKKTADTLLLKHKKKKIYINLVSKHMHFIAVNAKQGCKKPEDVVVYNGKDVSSAFEEQKKPVTDTKTENELKDLEAQRLKDLEAQRLKDLEAQRLKDLEAQRLKDLEAQRLKDLEAQRLKDLEAQRLKDLEAQRLKDLENKTKDEDPVVIPEGEPSKDWTKPQLVAYGSREYPELKLQTNWKEDTLLAKLAEAKAEKDKQTENPE